MINLTEDYLKEKNTILNRIKYFFKLDLFYASSLYDLTSYFKKYPPTKQDDGFKSALVTLDNIQIKRAIIDAENFEYLDERFYPGYSKLFKDEDQEFLERTALFELDIGQYFPYFFIKDNMNEMVASWRVGNSKYYKFFKQKFDFNQDSYVNIPVLILQYMHDNEDGWLRLIDLQDENICCPDKEFNIMKFYQVLGNLKKKPVLNPKPA